MKLRQSFRYTEDFGGSRFFIYEFYGLNEPYGIGFGVFDPRYSGSLMNFLFRVMVINRIKIRIKSTHLQFWAPPHVDLRHMHEGLCERSNDRPNCTVHLFILYFY